MDRYLEGGDNRKTQADLKYTALHIYQFVVYRNEICVRIFYSASNEIVLFQIIVCNNKYRNGESL